MVKHKKGERSETSKEIGGGDSMGDRFELVFVACPINVHSINSKVALLTLYLVSTYLRISGVSFSVEA